MDLNVDSMKNYSEMIYEYAIEYGINIISALIVLFIGFRVIKMFGTTLSNIMERKEVDASLRPFLASLTTNLLKALLLVSVLGMLGIEMTSFIAILGAAGLAVGMALSGTLQNFAGGVLILLFKPYQVGDFIDAQGHAGTVKAIQIFNTILTTPDNKTIIVPNGPLSTGSMTNFSTEPKRRVDWTIGIGYGDSTEKAREIMRSLLDADKRIHKDPEPFIKVSALADSSVNFAVRVWVDAPDYWDVFFKFNEDVYNAFNEQGINIPFPQMDVHVHKTS